MDTVAQQEQQQHIEWTTDAENPNVDIITVHGASSTAPEELKDKLTDLFSEMSEEQIKFSILWAAGVLIYRQEDDKREDFAAQDYAELEAADNDDGVINVRLQPCLSSLTG